MSLKSWLRTGSKSNSSGSRVRPRPSAQKARRGVRRLSLEALEDRLAPAAVSWTGNAGTLNWSDAGNWSNNAVPTSADDVTINKAGVGTITIGASTSAAVLSLNDTTARLAVSGGRSVATAATFGQNVTVAAGATLTVAAGASLLIKDNATVTISGTGTIGSAGGAQVAVAVEDFFNNDAEGISVANGGSLTINNAGFTRSGGTNNGINTSSTQVALGGTFSAGGSTFALDQVALATGSSIGIAGVTG